ncbi:MAG: serine/threonine protein kinase [Sandaracinaceae bacterium]|nr:serine/threonine protein kinase [Sandaracinaceae bacterium]
MGGRYRLGPLIGQGGMGTVYVATRESEATTVAVKLLRGSVRDRVALERFDREARAALLLDHPNVVRVLDYGVDAERPFLVMELLEGETLADLLDRERRLATPRALRIVDEIGTALEAAHARGVVHRDVKPENTFLVSGATGETVKLLDFGVAKVELDGPSSLTRSGTRLGTPPYMAPEQVRSSRSVDAACDQYALGVVLFELLTGTLPHLADTAEAMLRAKLAHPPRDLSALAPELSPGLAEAVMRALSPAPEDRFASISAFRTALASQACSIPTARGPG